MLLLEEPEVDLVGDLVAQGDRHVHRLAAVGDQSVHAGERSQVRQSAGVEVADELEGCMALAGLAGVGLGHECGDGFGGGVQAFHDELAARTGLGLLALLLDLFVAGNAQGDAFLFQFQLLGVKVSTVHDRHVSRSRDVLGKTKPRPVPRGWPRSSLGGTQ